MKRAVVFEALSMTQSWRAAEAILCVPVSSETLESTWHRTQESALIDLTSSSSQLRCRVLVFVGAFQKRWHLLGLDNPALVLDHLLR